MLTQVLASVLVACLAVELFMRLPFGALGQRMNRQLAKVVWTLRATHVSDHWKEKVLLRYSSQFAVLTLGLALCLAAVAAGVVGAAFGLDRALASGTSTLQHLASLNGIGIATLAAVVYMQVRRRLVAT